MRSFCDCEKSCTFWLKTAIENNVTNLSVGTAMLIIYKKTAKNPQKSLTWAADSGIIIYQIISGGLSVHKLFGELWIEGAFLTKLRVLAR